MKRFLTMCAVALAVMALAQQQASAWTKSSFSVGLAFNREASDNSLVHGWLYQNGPHPMAQGGDFGGYDGHGYDGHGFPGAEAVPFASTQQYAPVMQQQQQPMLPAPRPMPTIEQQRQSIAPATYWFSN